MLTPVTRAGPQELQLDAPVTAGSVGHPFMCSLACKFARKGNCKAGAQCTRCHLCVWRRSTAKAGALDRSKENVDKVIQQKQAPGPVALPMNWISLDGALPLCVLPSKPLQVMQQKEFSSRTLSTPPPPPPPVKRISLCDALTPNVGSVGHPSACSAVCKFAHKGKCNAGSQCSRCHLCVWRRGTAKTTPCDREQE